MERSFVFVIRLTCYEIQYYAAAKHGYSARESYKTLHFVGWKPALPWPLPPCGSAPDLAGSVFRVRQGLLMNHHRSGSNTSSGTTKKGVQEGHQNMSFCTLVGFVKIDATALKRMAGTTRLELATSAVTEMLGHCVMYRSGNSLDAL
jgi:hypothetical protein